MATLPLATPRSLVPRGSSCPAVARREEARHAIDVDEQLPVVMTIACPGCGEGGDVRIGADAEHAGRWLAVCGTCGHRWTFQD